MKISDMEEKLSKFFGKKDFNAMMKAAVDENPKATRRGLLNSLSQVVSPTEVSGLYAGTDVRTKGKDDNMTITRATFKLILDEAGESHVKFIRLHKLEYARDLPRTPPMLSGMKWKNVQKTYNVLTEKTSYSTMEGTTFEDDPSIKTTLPDIVTIREAIRRDRSKAELTKWLFQYIAGEVTQVQHNDSADYGEKLRVTITDKNDDNIRCNILDNLKDIFGEQDWFEDIDLVKNNLYRMEIVARGRVNFMENEENKQEIISFVIKNGGFIADAESITIDTSAMVDTPKEILTEEQSQADNPLIGKIKSYFDANDVGQGVLVKDLRAKTGITNEEIDELIEGGIIYEPALGLVKLV